jgi:hypothetical protein
VVLYMNADASCMALYEKKPDKNWLWPSVKCMAWCIQLVDKDFKLYKSHELQIARPN